MDSIFLNRIFYRDSYIWENYYLPSRYSRECIIFNTGYSDKWNMFVLRCRRIWVFPISGISKSLCHSMKRITCYWFWIMCNLCGTWKYAVSFGNQRFIAKCSVIWCASFVSERLVWISWGGEMKLSIYHVNTNAFLF